MGNVKIICRDCAAVPDFASLSGTRCVFFAGGESVLQLHMVHCIRQPVLTGLLFAAGKPAEAENYKQTGRVLTLCPLLSKEVSIREKTYRKRPAAG